jgi:ribosomal protein S19E (S16A)
MVRFKVEAFDLADKGDSLPYYRRAMSILNVVQKKPGIAMDKILGKFTQKEIRGVYPALGQKIIAALVGELELIGYVEVKDEKVTATDKGLKKLASYKKSLTAEERKALKLQ